MKILQANLHRSRTADALLPQIVVEQEADLVLISEQYRRIEGGTWFEDSTRTAAIWMPVNSTLQITFSGIGNGFVYVSTGEVTIISCYLTPSDDIQTFQTKLNEIEDKVQQLQGAFIIAGDFNSRAQEWGLPSTDSRGRKVLDMVARLGLIVANTGLASTFRRPGCEDTTPDITLVSESISRKLNSWQVLEIFTASDHQYISYVFGLQNTKSTAGNRRQNTRRWNVSKLCVERLTADFEKRCRTLNTSTGAREVVKQTMRAISQSCNVSMPKSRQRKHQPVYWWNEKIAQLRRDCNKTRRELTRARRRGNYFPQYEAYKLARGVFKKAILQSKNEKWAELCRAVDEDPWGLGYKIVMKKLASRKTIDLLNEDIMDNIVKTLFPAHPVRADELGQSADIPFAPFTENELQTAAKSFKNKKAPGPDDIPAEVLKALALKHPLPLLKMYNVCLKEGIFPVQWKKQKLVLISKGKGDPNTPSAYRPLCMLDTAGKLLEKLIKPRLEMAIEEAGGLSVRQHGFRKGKSTIGALDEVVQVAKATQLGNHFSRPVVLLATLDVKNAFNSVSWANMISALEDRFNIPAYLSRIIRSYLSNRELIYNTSNGSKTMEITAGAAQGSILGPDLWNISYDEIFKIEMPEDTFLVGYADDAAVVIRARDTINAQRKLTQVMIRTQNWFEAHGLTLATQKTELLLFTRRRIPLEIEMRVNNEVLMTQKFLKYLGIRLDPKLTFSEQLKYATNKAANITTALSRLMANTKGPLSTKRKILMEVSHSVLLYGSEVWADTLKTECRRKPLLAIQRTMALRIASAYRTVSSSAVMVIASVKPIDLLADERKLIYTLKVSGNLSNERAKEIKNKTIEVWQSRWEADTQGRWTASLIPNLKNWIERKHGEVNYYLTQFLSGHGYFRKYLYKMQKVENPGCIYCDCPEDDAEHTFFHCQRWFAERHEVEALLGVVNAVNIVRIMISDESKWQIVNRFIEKVLQLKKRDLDALD